MSIQEEIGLNALLRESTRPAEDIKRSEEVKHTQLEGSAI